MYLAKESIEFGYEAADWRDAVRQAGKLLLNAGAITAVSYTHLDVYKRQISRFMRMETLV